MLYKEWYTKEDILNIYPISISTYKKRLKTLKDLTKTKFIKSTRGSDTRLIHHSIIDELFRGRRRLNLKEKEDKTIKWVNNHYWCYKGNIVPVKGTIANITAKMRFIYEILQKQQKTKGHLTLFYSIEKNPNDKYYHAHFLIDCAKDMIRMEYIEEVLGLVCEPNTAKETRIYLKKYDLFYDKRGAIYATKEENYGYQLLD
mgnify:CR=1 FL=1